MTKKGGLRNIKIPEVLDIGLIVELIENKQLGWRGHVQEIKSERPVKQVWEIKI